MANATPGNNTELSNVTQTSENLNDSLPMQMRDPIGNCPKTKGPKVNEKTGGYEQAEYPIGKDISRRDR